MAKPKSQTETLAGDIDALTKDITLWGSDSDKLHERLAVLAARCVVCAVEHAQVSPTMKLIEVMKDRAYRVNDMKKWLIRFGPFDIKGDDVKFVKEKRTALQVEMNKDKLKFGSKLTSNPFWKWKKETTFQGFDLRSKLLAVLKEAQKIQLDANKLNSDKTDLTGLEDAIAFVNKLPTKDNHKVTVDPAVAEFNAAVQAQANVPTPAMQ